MNALIYVDIVRTWVFFYMKYGIFLSISPKQKVERKPLFFHKSVHVLDLLNAKLFV